MSAEPSSRAEWSSLAADMTWANLPPWLKLTAAHRWRAVDVDDLDRWSWHTWYRIALDYSRLEVYPRTVARVLCDWHGHKTLAVDPQSRDLAARVPCHPDHALRAIDTLEETGWVKVTRRPGRAARIVLLVPVDEPLTPAPRAGVTPAPRAAPPAPRAGVPRATRGTQGNRGSGASSGAPRVAKSDAVPRGRQANPWAFGGDSRARSGG